MIVLAVLDVYDIEKGFAGNIKLNEKESNVLFSPQTFEGTSEVIIYDYFDEGRSETFYYLRTADGIRYKLNFFQGQKPYLTSGENVIVTGTLSNVASGESEINVEDLEVLESNVAGAEPNPNLGEQRTAVILVNSIDNPVEPIKRLSKNSLSQP